ncbi:hypothetical protein [Bacillus paramobilis]|uniref:hypothetical protein n=1 Tax=Bacillus paramobilis TaxID=2817477 RepID=UPI001BB33D4E|nr:hypothetical protein [Bacillus paramobilis]
MAKVFDARRAIFIPATGGHPEGAEYRVAWGYEQWGQPTAVTKVQMVYNNKVAGRLSPSYPDGTLDERTVLLALDLVKKGYGTSSKKSKVVLVLKEIQPNETQEEVLERTEDEVHDMNIEIFSVPGAATSPVVGIELQKQVELEGNLVAFIFVVDVA